MSGELIYAVNGVDTFATSAHSPSTTASMRVTFKDENHLDDCGEENSQLRTTGSPISAGESDDDAVRTCEIARARPAFDEGHHVHAVPRAFPDEARIGDASESRPGFVPRLISHRYEAASQRSMATRRDRASYGEHTEHVVVNDWSTRRSPPAAHPPRRRSDHAEDDIREHSKRHHSADGASGLAAKRVDQGELVYSSGHYNDSQDDDRAEPVYSLAGDVYGRVGYVTAASYWPHDVSPYPQPRASSRERLEFINAFQKLLEETQNRQFEHDQRLQIQWAEAQSRADQERRLFEQRLEQDRRKFEQTAEKERRAFDERCARERSDLYCSLQKASQENQAWVLQRLTQFLGELSRRLF